jgi:hypothetical protein
MTYASHVWEFAANTHMLKFQRLQNKVIRAIWQVSKAQTGPRLE